MTASTTSERLVPAGKLYFDPFDTSGNKTGERYLGLTPGFTLSIASDKIESFTSENGIRTLDDSVLVSVTRTGNITCRQISDANLSMFIIGDISTYAQTGAAVTNEALNVLPDRYYQAGVVTGNPVGRQGLSSVSMTAGDAAIAWVTLTPKVVGDYIKGTVTPTYYFKCTTAGTTGGTEPTWANANDPGETITDGTVVWTNMGILIPVVTTDFTLDAILGRIYVVPGARVHPTISNPWAIDYTYATNSRTRIASSALASVNGALRFTAVNMRGANRDIFAPNVLLQPTGDAVFKADDPQYVELSWDCTFSQGVNGEAALYIDGRAV